MGKREKAEETAILHKIRPDMQAEAACIFYEHEFINDWFCVTMRINRDDRIIIGTKLDRGIGVVTQSGGWNLKAIKSNANALQ